MIFAFQFDPIGDASSTGNAEDILFSSLSLQVRDKQLFRLLDHNAKSVRDMVFASAYPLALWFAANWWRLRFEPRRDSLDWRLSHELQSAGSGYVWPRVVIVSDGREVEIASEVISPAPYEPVEYLTSARERIPASDFERGLDAFLEGTEGRLQGYGVSDSDFSLIWREVLNERADPKLTEWRRMEALVGYDAGEAPKILIDTLIHFMSEAGGEATEEVAAEDGARAAETMQELAELRGQEMDKAQVPDFDRVKSLTEQSIRPDFPTWMNARSAAAQTRAAWSLDKGAISSRSFAELLELPAELLGAVNSPRGRFAAGFRGDAAPESFGAVLHYRHPTSRRFALARLLADALFARQTDRLLPSTRANTDRQKFQRAFAQEFLCPFDDLMSFLGDESPDDDAIEDAAQTFDVSPWLIRTTLVNRGVIDRDRLSMDS